MKPHTPHMMTVLGRAFTEMPGTCSLAQV
jgi:hypothetical protein